MEGDLIKINEWLRPIAWFYGIGVRIRNAMFEAGILPTEWPEARQRKSRGTRRTEIPQESVAATQEAAEEPVEEDAQPIEESDAEATHEPEIEGRSPGWLST